MVAKSTTSTKLAMAKVGHQYSRGGISLSWPHGGDREVKAFKNPLPYDVERAILAGHIVRVTSPVTKEDAPPPKQRLLTGAEARARMAEPAGPVYRTKLVDGELVQIQVVNIAALPPREEIGTEVADEPESDEPISPEA